MNCKKSVNSTSGVFNRIIIIFLLASFTAIQLSSLGASYLDSFKKMIICFINLLSM